MKSKHVLFLSVGITAAIFLGAGILIGHFGISKDSSSSSSTEQLDITPFVIDEISAAEIGKYLRHLTSVPHVAGTIHDKEQAEWVKDRFLEFGLDEAKTVPYEVLLSYPRSDGVVNKVSLIDDQGVERFITSGRQPALGSPEESSGEIQLNFNAYSSPGVVQGNVVYANYGREEDFQYLISRGINVSGHIVLARYGAIFRGSKVKIAQRLGAIGVILYPDPRDKAPQGRNFTYPKSWWMPSMGVESGTVYTGEGDPLTPFYPSIASAYRINEEDQPGLPKIPVQPIGYDEAESFLRNISPENPANREDWIGGLNATYSLGPNPLNPGWTVKMNIHTRNQKRVAYNTIGILRGSVEEDRYVLVGNHRDAWAFGAVDPSSGTSSMLEIVRSLGKIKKEKKWRPRRTIVFCSWGAEEYGLIGSYEWTEQNAKALTQRAVAYLNVDIAVEGNKTINGKAFPTLKQLLVDSSKMIPNPNPEEIAAGRATVFDTWKANSPRDPNKPDQPNVANLGGGSDFKSFAYVLGVPATDLGYTTLYSYPTYHSLYDTYLLVSEIIDKGFVHHQAIARMMAVALVKLADSVILPYDLEAYPVYLNQSLSNLETRFGNQMQQNNATFQFFRESVNFFSAAVGNFSLALANVDLSNPLTVRRINDRMMYLERYFIDPRGLPNRPETNHVVFSTSVLDSYASDTFAGLVDLLAKVGNQSAIQDQKTWSQIKQHLSVIAFLIGEAARSLDHDL